MKRTAMQGTGSISLQFVSFRLVDVHWPDHELNCNELRRTGSEQFQVVATQFYCQLFAENVSRIIQFRR